MPGWWSGLVTWSHRAALATKDIDDERQRFQNAIGAENTLGELVASLGHLKEHVHLRRRVYAAEQNRSREIDVIAVCEALYVVEVKNWAGDIWRNETRWFQLPPRSGARAIEFGDVLEEIEYKAKVLVNFLVKNGIELPPGSVRAVVVFAHPKARLCPKTLLNHPSVFTKEGFQQLVGPRNALHDLLTAHVSSSVFAHPSEITPPLRNRISECLVKMRTWDTVRLHNGELHTGDIEVLCLVEVTEWQIKGDNVGWLSVKRRDIEVLTLSWAGTGLFGLVASLWSGSAGHLHLQVNPNLKVVSTKPVNGNPTPASQRKQPSSRRTKGERREVPASVAPFQFDVVLTTKVSSRDAAGVNHIVMRSAGQPKSSVFALSEIASIELSPR